MSMVAYLTQSNLANLRLAADTSADEMSVNVYSMGIPRCTRRSTTQRVVAPVPAPSSTMWNLPSSSGTDVLNAFSRNDVRSCDMMANIGAVVYTSSTRFRFALLLNRTERGSNWPPRNLDMSAPQRFKSVCSLACWGNCVTISLKRTLEWVFSTGMSERMYPLPS